ncbi:hypothetical protein F25303_6301 [Fusarium sp. NRRL 25303]|nr:hypothetical protein F25303_6301 [Fusarium sp. NRRL 25303]
MCQAMDRRANFRYEQSESENTHQVQQPSYHEIFNERLASLLIMQWHPGGVQNLESMGHNEALRIGYSDIHQSNKDMTKCLSLNEREASMHLPRNLARLHRPALGNSASCPSVLSRVAEAIPLVEEEAMDGRMSNPTSQVTFGDTAMHWSEPTEHEHLDPR